MIKVNFEDKIHNNGKNYKGIITAQNINEIKRAININASEKFEIICPQFIGKNLDTPSGRVDFDYINGVIKFQSNARFPNEPISLILNLPNSWKEGSDIIPILDWIQQSQEKPNWLLSYKFVSRGEEFEISTDYNNHLLKTISNELFAFQGNTISQTSVFEPIKTNGFKILDSIKINIFRDTENHSGLFQSIDLSGIDELIQSLSFILVKDGIGSSQENTK